MEVSLIQGDRSSGGIVTICDDEKGITIVDRDIPDNPILCFKALKYSTLKHIGIWDEGSFEKSDWDKIKKYSLMFEYLVESILRGYISATEFDLMYYSFTGEFVGRNPTRDDCIIL